MVEWFKKNKNFCLGILTFIIIVLSPVFVNELMNMSCSRDVNKSNDWIGFWGAYLGAVGSFIMTLIAYFTLRKNNEQLEFIKKQNRPYIYASIRKFIQQKEDIQAADTNKVYVAHTYYLTVINIGNTIAKEVKIDIQNNNPILSEDRRLKSKMSEINKTTIFVPPNEEKNFTLATRTYSSDLVREQIEEQKKFFDEFEKSSFDVKICYCWDFDKDKYENSFCIEDVTTDATTIVQMLDCIDNSIKKLYKTMGTKVCRCE